jgi:hypothetical protein
MHGAGGTLIEFVAIGRDHQREMWVLVNGK